MRIRNLNEQEYMKTLSLICTVRDEADNIAALLESMLAQSRLPDEIVINDCGSRDETAAIVQSYCARDQRIKLVVGGHNIPSGRNNAIATACGELIASTDAGLVLDRDWLARIIAPLEQNTADIVGGFFEPVSQSLFEQTLGATNYRNADEINPEQFLPFGKSMAFRKVVWEHVGGFPEWASHCEDIIFDRTVEQAGYRRAFAPEAIVFFRPRSSLRAFAQQYFFYARGDGIAGLWTTRHSIRYTTYTILLTLLLAGLCYPKLRLPVGILLMIGLGAYTRGPYRRLLPRIAACPYHQQVYALALVPVIRVVGDCAKMMGYPVGIRKRYSKTI
jgi:cellulose synthase/poly-beta-1,6-N-acetylglucosamine synthase-like glycosyltransferase